MSMAGKQQTWVLGCRECSKWRNFGAYRWPRPYWTTFEAERRA